MEGSFTPCGRAFRLGCSLELRYKKNSLNKPGGDPVPRLPRMPKKLQKPKAKAKRSSRARSAGMDKGVPASPSGESLLRELLENANDIIYTQDLQGNFTSVNKAAERITGYTRQ